MLVRRCLIENHGFEPLTVPGREILRGRGLSAVVVDNLHLHLTEEEILSLNAELIVVASTHRSESGTKALTTHATGNWTDDVSMGGRPRALSRTLAGALRSAFNALRDGAEGSNRLSGWWVGLEATHHGPYSPVPLIYVEFGGPAEARLDEEAAAVVAEACISACLARPSDSAAIGVGGGHYAPTFTRLMGEGEYDFAHILPKYALPDGIELLGQALERVADGCGVAVVDWKGVQSQFRERVVEELRGLGVEVVRQ